MQFNTSSDIGFSSSTIWRKKEENMNRKTDLKNMNSEDMKSDWKNMRVRDAVSPNLNMLQVLGYWPPEDAPKWKTNIYTIFRFFFVGFFYITYMISEFINMYLSALLGDLEAMTEASFLLLTHMDQFIKMYFFFKYSDRMKKFLDNLQSELCRPRNYRQYKLLASIKLQTNFSHYVFIATAFATCMLWGIFPLIDNGGQISLPLSGWYPFDTKTSPNFELVYAYQILSASINAASNVSMDTTSSGFMALICGQLDTLNDSLENIREFALENIKAPLGDELNPNNEEGGSERLNQEMERQLRRCVEHHKNILTMTEEIGKLFSISVLSQFAASCIIICLTMFKLTLVSLFSLQFVSMVLYQACMLFEIFLYCWYGNEIILKSSRLSLSAYKSDWIHCSQSYKKKLLFFMVNTKLPVKLYAGNFFTLSLETFAAILRTSWSYFAVLNSVHAEE